MTQYRKKPVEVFAWQFTGQDRPDWPELIKHHEDTAFRCDDQGNTAYIDIHTLEGVMTANIGDWIIQGTQGELYPCKPEIFAEIYEEVVE